MSNSRRVTIEFLGDDKSASRTARSVESNTSKLGNTLKSVGKTAAVGLGVGLAAATAGLVAFGKSAVDEAREAQKIGAQTEAVIKSTGSAANVTAKQVGDLANAISLKSGIDDEAIQSGENLLLTFTNIRNEAGKGNDVFNQATSIVTDMSVAMGQDMKSSAVLVGKALNDPIKGLSALSRVGVAFTDQQKKQITKMVESGHTMKAQKVILGELNKEFAGSAEAQATAGEKASVAWANLQESIGMKLLPLLDKLELWFATKVVPALYQFSDWFQREAVPVIKHFAEVAGQKIQQFVELVRRHWPEIRRVIAKVLDDVVTTVQDVITVIVKIWNKWGDDIWRIAKVYFSYIYHSVKNSLKVIQGVIDVVTGLIHGDWGQVWKGIKEIFSGVWAQMGNTVKTALKAMREVIRSAWDGIKDLFKRGGSALWDLQKKIWQTELDIAKKFLGLILDGVKWALGKIKDGFLLYFRVYKTIFTTWFGLLKTVTVDRIGDIVGIIKSIPDKLTSLPGRLLRIGKSIIGNLKSGVVDAMSGISGWVKDKIVDPIIHAVKDFFGIASPSKVMRGLGGHLIDGLIDGMSPGNWIDIAKKIFGGMPEALGHVVKKGFVSVADLPKKALSALADAGINLGGQLAGALDTSLYGPSLSNQQIGRRLLDAMGWGAYWPQFNALVMGESGWNNYAQNPTTTAFGIGQFLDSTWATVGYAKTTDAGLQIAAMLKYIAQKYGNPANAYSQWLARSPHWYRSGLDNGLFTKPTLIGVGEAGPERVSVTPIGRESGGAEYVGKVVLVLDGKVIQESLLRLKRRNGGLELGLG